MRSLRGVVALCATLLVLSGCGSAGDGLTKYPVQGKVTLDGEPTADLVVRLIGKSDSPDGANARFPVGVTDDDGVFRISTNGEADGAVPGDYDVTIFWPESNEPPLRDRLGGAYATAEKSKLKVTIEPRENVLETFELKRPQGAVSNQSMRSEDE